MILAGFGVAEARGQAVFSVDAFGAAGMGSNGYATGKITNVWGNWFGGAFQGLSWDAGNDADHNAASGAMKISANFIGGSNQFAVYMVNGVYPPVNGTQFTNFQCDVRFGQGSATVMANGAPTYGHLEFGAPNGNGQDYFGSVDVPGNTTNWVHVSLPIRAGLDLNLRAIYGLIFHIYGPYYGPGLSGASTLWVDNIKFEGTTATTTNCVVNWNDVHQRIDGFGASSAWRGNWTAAEADMFFSTNNGIGLSFLRTRIAPGGGTVEGGIMQMAQARGARVWSAPWSPAAQFKDNHNVNGGNFLSASNLAYARQLAGYVVNIKKTYGVDLYALSVQNEPAFAANYESCVWTAQQIHDFAPFLRSALVASNVAGTKILLAEDQSWRTNLFGVSMADAAVATNVAIVACHNYDGNPPSGIPAALPKLANAAAALWETEVSTFDTYDGSITNAMYWADRIHWFLTGAGVNAFHYWWLIPTSADNQGLTDPAGNPAKRMYALGNFSRFVRPGYERVGVSNNAFTAVSAYKETNSGRFAIVAVNSSASVVTQIFNLASFTATSVTPWVTSGALSLASQSAVAVANGSFTYALPALSVVTFVGQAAVIPASITITGAAMDANHFALTWNAVPGATYSVFKKNTLGGLGSNWEAIIRGYPAGGAVGSSVSYTDAAVNVAPSFYRVGSP